MGNTALHLAVENLFYICSKLIIEYYPSTLIQKDKCGNTPIHCIVKNQFVEGCKFAMKHAIPTYLNFQNDEFLTPIHLAARENAYPILKLFLAKIGNIANIMNPETLNTPLHLAAEAGASKCVYILLVNILKNKNEEYINLQNNENMTALMIAAKLGNTACCTFIIKHAELDIANDVGWTALHFAAKISQRKIVKKLIKNGADASKRTADDNLTAFSHAAGATEPGCLEYMLKKFEKTESCEFLLKTATQNMSEECLKLLLVRDDIKECINHQFKDDCNETLLHMSIKNNNYKMSQILLENGANWHLKNSNNEYPFHLVAKQQVTQSIQDKEVQQDVCTRVFKNIHRLIGSTTR